MIATTGSFYLTTYTPLVASKTGRAASEVRTIYPFVDGSIRREPDLEHEYPAISCLCRKGKFAPRLNVGDTVAYMTVKRRFGTDNPPHRRLTAVLGVIERLNSHQEAAAWYRSRSFPLPNNCMVEGNLPKPLDESHVLHHRAREATGNALVRIWDGEYRKRAREFGTVLICRIIYRSLGWDSPVVDDDILRTAFGKIPGTQNPGEVSAADFRKFMRLLGIPYSPSAP